MSQVEEQPECPLCMEPFEVDDLNFFPCTCGYQICRFCWHRIRTDENGLCPACRKAYPENPADFKPLSQEQVAKMKAEKRHKEQQRKQKATESRKHLANVRVVQKNLVFVVGLPIRLADTQMLKKHEYFGKFGRIHKVVINQSTTYAGATGPSASAYVTYNRCDDALRAIQAVNNICVDSKILKTSLGTTKYCSHFIKSQTCPKPDCMYLHDFGDSEASFTKEEMQQGKHQEYEKKLHEQLNSLGTVEKKAASPKQEAWPSLQLNGSGGTAPTPQLTPPSDAPDTIKPLQQIQTGQQNQNSNLNSNINKSYKTRHGKDKNQQENNKGKRRGKEKNEGGLAVSMSETGIANGLLQSSQNFNHMARSSSADYVDESTSHFSMNGFNGGSTGTNDALEVSEQTKTSPSIEKTERLVETPSPLSEPRTPSPQEIGFPTRYQNGYQNGFHVIEDQPPVEIIKEDDELDFDPFQETQKGLADLLEKELLLQQKAMEQPAPSYHNHSNVHHLYHPQHLHQQHHSYLDTAPNHSDSSILHAQLHSNLLQRSANGRIDHRTMPPPGFPTNSNPGLYNRGTNGTKLLPPFFMNGDVVLPTQCLQNVPKLSDWPESLRSLVNTAPPQVQVHQMAHHHNHNIANKGWSNQASTFADWTALDPAIVSSSRPQLVNIHSPPPALFPNQGVNPLNGTQLNMASLGHNGWSHRYHDAFFKNSLIHNTSVPPPGFSLRHPASELKQTLPPGIETME